MLNLKILAGLMIFGLVLLVFSSGATRNTTGAFFTDNEVSKQNSFSVAAVFPSSCGNGVVEEGEVCDGNSQNCFTGSGYAGSQTCNNQCSGWNECISTEYCGDGIKNGYEECDDGNTNNSDSCSNLCLLNSICTARPDVMFVFQSSGGTSGDMDLLKSAAHSFVNALNPMPDGPHIGQVSYSDEGRIDLNLTGNRTAIDNAIDALTSGSNTNLYGGLLNATTELTGPNDRNDELSPDYMIVIANKMPNKPKSTPEGKAMAIQQANLAKSLGIKIYVVFVGTNEVERDWYRTNIPTNSSYFFTAKNYAELNSVLQGIANC